MPTYAEYKIVMDAAQLHLDMQEKKPMHERTTSDNKLGVLRENTGLLNPRTNEVNNLISKFKSPNSAQKNCPLTNDQMKQYREIETIMKPILEEQANQNKAIIAENKSAMPSPPPPPSKAPVNNAALNRNLANARRVEENNAIQQRQANRNTQSSSSVTSAGGESRQDANKKSMLSRIQKALFRSTPDTKQDTKPGNKKPPKNTNS